MSRTPIPAQDANEALAAIERLRAQGVDVVRINYCDLHGVPRGKDVPLAAFANVAADGFGACAANLADGLNFSLANLAERVAGSPQNNCASAGIAEFPDMRVRVILSSLVQLPWDTATAWCLASIDPADAQSPCSTRNLLQRAVDEFRALGVTPQCAPELEFYLLRRDAQGQFHRYTDELSMVYTVGARSDPQGVVLEMLRAGQQLGLDVIASHHECGRGQYEINLNYGEALDAADRCFRFKAMVKELAARHNLLATFMGKPYSDDAGSGFHLHVSMADRSGNRFHDAAAPDGISVLGRHFLGGVLNHAAALTAFYSPTVNSYKRYVAGTLVPTAINWGYDNRTTLVRIPNERGAATRLEIRAADAAANPYLVVAATLLAGLDGIRRELEPGPPTAADGSATNSTDAPLPRSLNESLDALQEDHALVAAVGKPLVSAFCAAKAMEAERYRLQVTDWELNEYAWHL